MFRYKRWHSDTKIHVEPVLDLLCGTSGDLVSLSSSSRFLRTQGFGFPWRSTRGQCHELDTLGLGRRNHAVDINTRNVDSGSIQGADGNDLISLEAG